MKEQAFENQVKQGDRFEFGKNWKAFLGTLSEANIGIAKDSLKTMLQCNDLEGKTFLDVGCGSGLFSLAAMQLGASVFSFDFDPNSVKCTEILKEKYFPNSNKWKIEKGSVLDKEYISSLGKFDIVYSWGVLHHTGNLQAALENVDIPVNERGKLFIAIYNDQGHISDRWKKVKKIYNSGFLGRMLITWTYIPYFFIRRLFSDLRRFKNPTAWYKKYKKERGMSQFYDWVDWLGGWPFEVATPALIFEKYQKMNYSLAKLKSDTDLGCNEFVFVKN